MDITSSIQEFSLAPGINERIAACVRELRDRRGLSLEALAEASGVSRSMISLIERGESSPTAVVLERLATGLGVSLATLFEAPAATPHPVSRRPDQVEWRDPASGYLRRNVSPGGFPSPIQIVEVVFPAGARVAYETAARPGITHQQVWVLEGTIKVVLGEERFELGAGDCLAMVLDRPITYHNPAAKPARYCVVIVASPPA
ncbi:helix-turn-helix domain-containing protein [Reyranella sp.]|uniref:helix-turn-helix domain-containing protein n=1 Tax=Reyranella sp. TaxID=1929291 RepID=UPI003D137BD3